MPSKAGSVLSYFFVDIIGSVLRFPLWWYTTGFLSLLRWVGRELSYRWLSYNFRIWFKNFFVPMYGQHDITGRLVSVFMRFVVLIGRLIGYAVEAFAYIVLLIAWLLAPPVFLFFFLQSFFVGAFVNQVKNLVP